MHQNSDINFKKGDNPYLGYRDQMKSDQRIFFIDILQDIQKEANLGQLHRTSESFNNAIVVTSGSLGHGILAQSGKLYDCFRDAFGHCFAPEHNKETVTDAEALLQKISCFEMVFTAQLFHKIFTITDPTSLYLQSEKI